MYLKIVFPPLLQQFWSVWNDFTHMYKSLVFGDEFMAQGSSTLTESSFVFDPCLIQRHCHVRREKGPVQTVAIKLEAHNSPEYHYMLQH